MFTLQMRMGFEDIVCANDQSRANHCSVFFCVLHSDSFVVPYSLHIVILTSNSIALRYVHVICDYKVQLKLGRTCYVVED